MRIPLLIIVSALIIYPVLAECYGAEACNPTGSPIGGGLGYTHVVSERDADYLISTKEELLSALDSAKSGDIVFVKGTAAIDMNGTSEVIIPAGVTLASDRGVGGSPGALINKTVNTTNSFNEAMFLAERGARVTGLRIYGEMQPQDYNETPDRNWLVGLHTHEYMEVDNNEIRGWSCAGILLGGYSNPVGDGYIHHNFIYENQAKGLGDGILVYGGDVLIEANIFDYNRHSIAASGTTGERYEARYNIEGGHGNTGAHRWDVHPNPISGGFTGDSYKFHHNTFNATGYYDIKYRGEEPQSGVWIDHNIFIWSDIETTPILAHTNTTGSIKLHTYDNIINQKTVPGSDGIVTFVGTAVPVSFTEIADATSGAFQRVTFPYSFNKTSTTNITVVMTHFECTETLCGFWIVPYNDGKTVATDSPIWISPPQYKTSNGTIDVKSAIERSLINHVSMTKPGTPKNRGW